MRFRRHRHALARGQPMIWLTDNRAHTLQEYGTLAVPHIFVADEIRVSGPKELGLPVQVPTLPWITRSRFLARHEMTGKSLMKSMRPSPSESLMSWMAFWRTKSIRPAAHSDRPYQHRWGQLRQRTSGDVGPDSQQKIW